MAGSHQHCILPLHHSPVGLQTAVPVGSQEAISSSATQSAIVSPPSSAEPSAIPPLGIPLAALPASHTSPAVPVSKPPSRTSPATALPATSISTTPNPAVGVTEQATTTGNGVAPLKAPAGYPQLASKMSDRPEMAIFRRFGFLNAQNLLYMQAELVCLEDRLRKLQAKDNEATGSRSEYANNWFFLSDSADQEDGDDSQWELVKEIRGKLKEYNKMLIQQLKIISVNPPGSYDLGYMQRYLASKEMDDGVLSGKDSDVWGSFENPKDHSPDLLALLGRHNEDIFSSWVTDSFADKLIDFLQRRKPSRELSLDDFTDKKLLRWTLMIASALASALPVLSIAILYWVQSIKVRLMLIAVFNVVLSFALAWFTSAKRAEVFAISAAFSAVQVVFVQVGTSDSQGMNS